MMNKWEPLAVLLALALTGCSTAYQEARDNPIELLSASGYKEQAGPGDLIKVTYKGSPSMLMYQVETYALYRCAEVAQRKGAPYFGLYQTLPDALSDRRSSSVRPTTLLGVPHAEVYVAPHKLAAPGLLSTAEVLARLAPQVKAGAR